MLIYHNFPRIDSKKVTSLSAPLPERIEIADSLPRKLRALTVSSANGQALVSWSTRDTSVTTGANGEALRPVTFETAKETATRWLNAPITKVDTLHERDQWIMYSRYIDELPIYKFHYGDKDKSELYVASRTAEPLQFTTRSSRFWAWIGAIPHKLYFPAMRKNVDHWKIWLATGATICLIASLTGLYAALYMWIRNRRRTGKWYNPFHGRLLRLHFTLGLIFAIPLIAWSISGIFSMQKMPKWLIPAEINTTVPYSKVWGKGLLPLSEYKLKYENVYKAFPEMRELDYGRAGDIPTYTVITPERTVVLDARGEDPAELSLTENDIKRAVTEFFDSKYDISIELIDKYDNLYYSLYNSSPLPVYKVTVDDKDGSVLYIDKSDGHVTYLNRNRIARKFLFSGIHYLNLRPFAGHTVIWQICIWMICLTGMVFCFTSAWIGWKYLKRVFRPHR